MRSLSESNSANSLALLRTLDLGMSGGGYTVDALIFSLVIDVVKISKDFDGCDVSSGIIDDPLCSILDEEFE
jgi:hypothetical protein